MAREIVFRESAQVKSRMVDLSKISSVPNYAFFAVVTASKGELNKPVLINGLSTSHLKAAFGEVTKEHIGLVCVAKLIEKGLNGYIVRVAGSDAKSASVDVPMAEGDHKVTVSAKDVGTDGNKYSIGVATADGKTELTILKDGVILDSVEVTLTDPDDPKYILSIENDLFTLTSEDFDPTTDALKDGTYLLSGGNDGLNVTADDYVGASTEAGNTGVYAFLNRSLKGQFISTFGVADKEIAVAMKAVADDRKDLTVIVDSPAGLTKKQVEDWREATGSYADTKFLDGFNMELYWDWQKDTWEGDEVTLPPSLYVIMNSLLSYQANGPWLPVAGDERGVIDSKEVVTRIDKVVDRDSLVSHNINPIFDTGVRGIQIYGNETLNGEYTDLSAAHIARTFTYIRGTVDDVTERYKFELNEPTMWDMWVAHVEEILQPIKNAKGLHWSRVIMGDSITTREELAQRIVRGRVELQFTQDAEIFVLEYVVHASSENIE